MSAAITLAMSKYPPITYGEYRVWQLNTNYGAKLAEGKALPQRGRKGCAEDAMAPKSSRRQRILGDLCGEMLFLDEEIQHGQDPENPARPHQHRVSRECLPARLGVAHRLCPGDPTRRH